jgi:ferritin-like metal-binding protein YciE
MAEISKRDGKLIQYLNEAYGKEKELETALQAHIEMTTRMPYKKRLREHLTETRGHAREVKKRIKALGGKAEETPVPGPDVVAGAASKVTAAATKAVAAAKGPVHAIRGTGEAEKMLKNAKDEYWNEFEEIATYYAIEALADEVGDKETHRLARSIRRDEERMARFLEKQIPSLVKAVAKEEIPAAERKTASRSSSRGSSARKSSSSRKRSSSSKRSSSNGGSARSGSASSRGGSKSRASGSRKSTASRKSTTSRNGSSSSRSRSTRARSGSRS